MNKTPDKSIVTPSPSLQEEGTVLGGGWRIKERKASPPASSARQDASLARVGHGKDADQTVSVPDADMSAQGRRWCHPFGVLASLSVAAVALIMVADVPSAWFGQAGISPPANAETHEASTSTQDQTSTVPQTVPVDGYQLHLGSYPSELGARLMWAGLTADSDTLLQGLDPSFEHQQDDGYHVLAGTYSRLDMANSHCTWLKERKVACSIVGG